MPSPQKVKVHTVLHKSLLFWLPSSHCSFCCFTPSPHNGNSVVHWALHPSPFMLFPSSHCSLPFLIPSPQNSIMTVELSVSLTLPALEWPIAMAVLT